MSRVALLVFHALLLCAPQVVADDTTIEAATLEANFENLRTLFEEWRTQSSDDARDTRGRRAIDDLEQSVFTSELFARIRRLIDAGALDDARNEMGEAAVRANEVMEYWNDVPTISWRQRWSAFANGNGIDREPGEGLLALERALHQALDAGEFVAAAVKVRELETALDAAIASTSNELLRELDDSRLEYVRHQSPLCGQRKERSGDDRAGLSDAASPDRFYPPGSRSREETGVIVVRTLVKADGCADRTAVLVSSGFPDLDAAAVEVAAHSRFTAAIQRGKAVDGHVTYKVRFTLTESP